MGYVRWRVLKIFAYHGDDILWGAAVAWAREAEALHHFLGGRRKVPICVLHSQNRFHTFHGTPLLYHVNR